MNAVDAEPPAASVAVAGDGAQLMPAGAFSQENVTPPEKPFVDVALHFVLADPPAGKVSDVGEHVHVNPGAGVGEGDGDGGGGGGAVCVADGPGVGAGEGT